MTEVAANTIPEHNEVVSFSPLNSPLSPRVARKTVKGMMESLKHTSISSEKSKRFTGEGSPSPVRRVHRESKHRFSLNLDATSFSNGQGDGSSSSSSADDRGFKASFLGKKRSSKALQRELQLAEDEMMFERERMEQEAVTQQIMEQKNYQIMKLKDVVAKEHKATKAAEEKLAAALSEKEEMNNKMAIIEQKYKDAMKKIEKLGHNLEEEMAKNSSVYSWCIELNEENVRLKGGDNIPLESVADA